MLFSLALCLPASAVFVRPDRDDGEYLELATRYPSSVALEPADGAGTLIAPRWILTSARNARRLREGKPPPLSFGGNSHAIQAVFLVPDPDKDAGPELGLLLLSTPVAGIEPTPIYRGHDENGKTVRIVGHGLTGKIGANPPDAIRDRKRRAAINTVDRVTAWTLGLRIKGNDEASDLQGAAAPGDGGGPAFIETREGIFVAGVGLGTQDANGDGVLGNIGDWELYVRVSAFAGWIDEVMTRVAREALEAAAREAAATVGDTERR